MPKGMEPWRKKIYIQTLFLKVKCTKISWNAEQEWANLNEKKNHKDFDGTIVFFLCDHLREAFIHILNGKRQLKQVVYY